MVPFKITFSRKDCQSLVDKGIGRRAISNSFDQKWNKEEKVIDVSDERLGKAAEKRAG